jgi:hypothetical protein
LIKLWHWVIKWLASINASKPAPYVPPTPSHKVVTVSREFDHPFEGDIRAPWYWDESAYAKADKVAWPSALKEFVKKLPREFKGGFPAFGVDVSIVPLSETKARVTYSTKVKI